MDSKNGMLTWVWGPVMWYVLHYVSFRYPQNPTQEDKQLYYNFVFYLKYVLPCGACRENYISNISELPLKTHHLKNTCSFAAWVYNFHNVVNKMTKKHPYTPPTFEEVVKIYNDPAVYDAFVTISIIPKTKRVQNNIESNCSVKSNVNSDMNAFALPFWFILLCISFNYPIEPTNEQKINYSMFFNTCFQIYRNMFTINTHPISIHDSCLKNRYQFTNHIIYLLSLHNKIQYEYNTIHNIIEKFRAKCVQNNKNKESGCTQILSGKKCKAIVSINSFKTECNDFMKMIIISPECFK